MEASPEPRKTSLDSVHKELLDYFLSELRKSDRADGTVLNIERDIRKFLEFLGNRELDANSLKDYIDSIESLYSETSFLSKLSSLRQFVNWLNLRENPFWSQKISAKRDLDSYYSEQEIFSPIRDDYDFLLVSCIYEFSLSMKDLCELNLGDYNQASSTISIRGLEIKAPEALKILFKSYLKGEYFEWNDTRSFAVDAPLLVYARYGLEGHQGPVYERITELELRRRLSEYNLRALYIRKSKIIHLLQKGLDPKQLEKDFGLKLSSVYEPYIQAPDYRLMQAYKDYHPRAHKQAYEKRNLTEASAET